MYSHDGTWDFLKLLAVLVFICVAVVWLQGAIGADYTVLVIFAVVGVIVFAGGALLSHAIQKNTLNAITRFNASDAQIDRYRMQSLKAQSSGEAAMKKAAAQLTVLDAKRTHQIASQQAKLLVDTERAKWEVEQRPTPTNADVWSGDDDDDGDAFAGWR
jgi:hypothetical protein